MHAKHLHTTSFLHSMKQYPNPRRIFFRLVFILSGIGIGIVLSEILVIFIIGRHSALPLRTILYNKGLTFSAPTETLRYFYEPTPNSTETWNPSWLTQPVNNHINADSLNEIQDYPADTPPHTYRIVVLGDSFTYGHFVPTPQNYSKVLETMVNQHLRCPDITHIDVINLGIPGYDITYSIERLKRRGIKYHPDLVVWLINPWNMVSINEERIPLQMKISKLGIPVFNEKTRLNDAVSMAIESIKQRFGEEGIRTYQRQAFAELPTFYANELLLMSFPGMPDKDKKVITTFVSTHPHYHFWELPFVYDTSFQYQLFDHHPNALGHQRIAQELFTYLTTHQLSFCITNDAKKTN